LISNERAINKRIRALSARSSVCDRLRSEGVDDELGGINRFTSVADALESLAP